MLFGNFGSVQLDPKDKAMYGADGSIKVGTNLLGDNKFSTASPKPISTEIPSINSISPEITPAINPESLETKSINNNNDQSQLRQVISQLKQALVIDSDKMGDKIGAKVKEAVAEVKFNVSAKVNNKELLAIQQDTALTTESKIQ